MQQSAADDNMEALRMLEASFATLPDHPETDRAKQPCDPKALSLLRTSHRSIESRVARAEPGGVGRGSACRRTI